ncbi:MAG TPA: O-antigen ligase family protein [Thermoanaerobaculia bacterium]|nr:O-antigen ligase family protein [Thermoanaerobaculia bacterium]
MLKNGRFPVLLVLAAFGSEMFLGDIDIGPASPRVYLYAGLIGWFALRVILMREPLVRDRRAIPLLAVYSLFILWAFVALTLQDLPVARVIVEIVKSHGLALVLFLVLLFVLRTREQTTLFARGIVLLTALSSAVAIAQIFYISAPWTIWSRLRPLAQMIGDQPGFVDTGDGPVRMPPPGLFAAAFTFGYYLAALVPVAVSMYLVRRNLRNALIALTAVLGVIAVQQRSALLATAICLPVLLLMHGAESHRLRRVIMGMLLLLIAGGLFISRNAPTDDDPSSLGRYSHFMDRGRLQVADTALAFIVDHPFTGGAIEYVHFYQSRLRSDAVYDVIAPHNLFLNAAVFLGFPGLMLILLFLVTLGLVFVSVWRTARRRHDWLAIGSIFGLAGYLINAQFHNASFVTGDVLPWWLIAIALSATRVPMPAPVVVAKKQAPARRLAPRALPARSHA